MLGKRRAAGAQRKGKAKQAAPAMPNLSQGDSETDDSELDFDPRVLLVQLNAKKTQKTKKDTRKLQRWSSEVIRRVRCVRLMRVLVFSRVCVATDHGAPCSAG